MQKRKVFYLYDFITEVEVVLVMFADFEHFMQKFAYVFQKEEVLSRGQDMGRSTSVMRS